MPCKLKINFKKCGFFHPVKIFLIFVCIFFNSCASTGFAGKTLMTGTVRDEKGSPVEGYEIIVDGKKTCTDLNGIFSFENISSGRYVITGGKKGYTSASENYFFCDKRDICCIQVEKISTFYSKIEMLLKTGDVDVAAELLLSEKKHNGEMELFRIYEQIVDYLKSPDEEKKQILFAKIDRLSGGE